MAFLGNNYEIKTKYLYCNLVSLYLLMCIMCVANLYNRVNENDCAFSRVVRHDLGGRGRLRAGGGDGERVGGVLGRVVRLRGGAAAALAGAGRRAARRARAHRARLHRAAARHRQQGTLLSFPKLIIMLCISPQCLQL